MNNNDYKLLPVAIMAHNEEKVIKCAVESVLMQSIPDQYKLLVVVVANGCTDKTEDIVSEISSKCDNVVLVAISKKGKTTAINESIRYLSEIEKNKGISIHDVVFLDADCEFADKQTLSKIISRFEKTPQLCAVSAYCVPDVIFNDRTDLVSKIYRSIYKISDNIQINSITGMCYGITFDALKKIDFPEIQFAEDMFLSSRLSGWFLKDKNVKIIFKCPSNITNEIKRRTRQEKSTQRYHAYYSFLKSKEGKIKINEGCLSEEYKWYGARKSNLFSYLMESNSMSEAISIIFYFIITGYAKLRVKISNYSNVKNKTEDHWKVIR